MNEIIDILSEYLTIPKHWINDRLVTASKMNKSIEDGWLLLTEFGDPYCYVTDASESNLETVELKIFGLFNSQHELNHAIVLMNSGVHFIYKWNRITNTVMKSTVYGEVFKLYDRKVLLRRTANKENGDLDLKPLDSRNLKLENTFFQLHSVIRDIDGLHADIALDEICKMLYVKLFDEEHTKIGEYYKFQRNRYLSAEECAAAIRYLYKAANDYDQRVFSLRIPGYKRSRGVFDSPILLSSEAMMKMVDLLQYHSFLNTDTDLKGRLFQNLISPVLRGGLGQYFTPTEIVELIVCLMRPTLSDLIIDPFAGSGHFLSSAIKYVQIHNRELTNKRLDEFLFHNIHGIEISERMVRISMTDMRLHGDGHSNIRCIDALLDFSNYQDLVKGSFDIVMTNPPFGSLLSSDNISRLGHFEILKGKKNIPMEVLGLERSIELLRPGGKLAIVLPESILVNSNQKYVREWLLENITIIALVSLPIETFSPFGANIKTSIILAKKMLNSPNEKTQKVFIADIKHIGYDSAGRKTETSDIESVIRDFDKFIKTNKLLW